jgi:hypothetical protein
MEVVCHRAYKENYPNYLFSPQNRAVAFFMKKGSKHLGRLKNGPGWPFLFLLGGEEIMA